MAKQIINLGTEVLKGKDGDSNRAANTKNNSNHTELYNALGADQQGNLPQSLPIAKGGTGATTVEVAKQNLGIDRVDNTPDAEKPISVATQQALDTKADNAATQAALDTKVNTSDVIAIAKGGTGATTAEQARANLGLTPIRLNAGTDLNTVTTAGVYYCDANADVATMLNIPIAMSFSLKVDITAGVIQELTTYASGGSRRFIRGFYYEWSQWEEVLKGHKRLSFSEANQTGIVAPNTQAGIYIHDNGHPFLWKGAATTAPRWNIEAGGTGGTTAAEARTNLGLGSAATRSVGTSPGNVMEVGAFGVGSNFLLENSSAVPPGRTGFYSFAQETFAYSGTNSMGIVLSGADGGAGKNISTLLFRDTNDLLLYKETNQGFQVKAVLTNPSTNNTTTDSNGFIKAASPIVQLFAEKIELNDEAQLQEIVFEKLGVGEYLIKGSTGLAQEGWYVEQPKDSNGNIYHAVEYGTHTNGDIWIKTYEQMMDGTRIVADHTKPIDIKDNRFITIRLNELPKDTSAPINPTVKDNEGNAAPSRLHELVNGVWVISDENAAILEQERLAAMKPLKRRQFRLTLAMNGYDLNEIEALIDQIKDPMQRTIAKIEWQDATEFERTNPTLLKMVEMMQLTTAQVDELWAFGLSL